MFRFSRIVAVIALIVVAGIPVALAKGNDVEFQGTVVAVTMTSATQGVLTLRLMGNQVAVRLTGETDIEAHGDESSLDDVSIGDFVKVSGFFGDSTIVANEIEVLDRGEGEFRLRGPITSVQVTSGGTLIKVLGVDVLVNSDTEITRRGFDRFTVANLTIGMMVDTRGGSNDGQFVAKRVIVGFREDDAIRVEFGGRITAVATGKLNVDTEGGSTAVVLISTATSLVGTPAVGRFVDVRGTLNSAFEVVASRIIVKTGRDSDDPESRPSPVEFNKEISLTPSTDSAGIRGQAELEVERRDVVTEQEFRLKITRAQGNTEYRIIVNFGSSGPIDFGIVRTNGEGSAEVRFNTETSDPRRDLRTLIPAGKTIRDVVSVRVLLGTTVVLQGTF